jgi:hypothetical protein
MKKEKIRGTTEDTENTEEEEREENHTPKYSWQSHVAE